MSSVIQNNQGSSNNVASYNSNSSAQLTKFAKAGKK